MTKLQFLKGRETGKLSHNTEEGKLSFCLCCCPNIRNFPLYYHYLPIDEGTCFDAGGTTAGAGGPMTWQPSTYCEEWYYTARNIINYEAIFCSDPSGPGQIEVNHYGVMRCEEVNEFSIDICMTTTEAEPEDPDQCEQLDYSIPLDGGDEFCRLASDPDYTPGSGSVFLDAGIVHFYQCGDDCSWRLVITDNEIYNPSSLITTIPGAATTRARGNTPLPLEVSAWLE